MTICSTAELKTDTRRTSAARVQAWGLFEWIVSNLPGPAGERLRYLFWQRRLRHLGKKVRFGLGVRISGPHSVTIGDYCWIDDYVVITAGSLADGKRHVFRKSNASYTCQEGEVSIGNRVHVAPFVHLQGHGGLQVGNCLTIAAGARVYSLSHHYSDLTDSGAAGTIWKFVGLVPQDQQALISAPTVIKDNAAVGLNSVVLPGSTIGRNSWLGAGSLLSGELTDNVVAAGVPARVLKERF